MKKLLLTIMTVSLLLLSASCGSSVDVPSGDTDTAETDTAVLQNEYLSAEEIAARGHISLAEEYVSEVSVGYHNADGTKTLYVYAQPVNYMNERMEWVPIQTAIKEVDETRMRDMGYRYTIEASDVKSYYPESLSAELGIKLQKSLYEFGVTGEAAYGAEYTERSNFIGKYRDMIVYRDAVQGADLYVYPSTLGSNVEIEIEQPFEKNQFQLWVKVKEGVKLVKQPGGYLTIEATENEETEIVGVIQKPLLRDSEGNYSYGGTIRSVREVEDGYYIITFGVEAELNQGGTSVFVAMEVRREKQPDNCLYSAKPALTHAYLANYSVLGRSEDYGIGRLMLRYTLSPFALRPEQIRSATYELYSLTNTGADVELVTVLEDWCSITGNWNSQYETGEPVYQGSFADHVWTFDITESVKTWFGDESAQLEHNGLQLKYINEEENGSDMILSNDNSLYMNVTIITFE